jgi:peptidoglycan-associated lipoprotein
MLKKLLGIAVASFILAGCSTTGSDANGSNPDAAAVQNGSGIQTSGVGGYGDSSGLSNPDAMVPGAAQRYFFDFNQSTVHSSDLPSIKVQANYLISHPSKVAKLEGNTDIVGSREYNLALGQRRADAVQQALLLDGANKKQLTTISYGSEKPIAKGNSESDYAQNRRVDMEYKSH